MFLLLGFAFLSGLVTILAPCIWPILPIVLSSTVAGGGGGKRPLGITLGIMLSFLVFTLFLSSLVKVLHFDANLLRIFAVVVIGALGLTMIIPAFSKILESRISRLSGLFGRSSSKQDNGFPGGFITGLSLGVVWSPCAGPILAAIATLAATNQVTINVVLVTVAYVVGIGIPLFAFAYGGQKFITKSRFVSQYTGRIQQAFGVIMLLTALAILIGYDQKLELKLLEIFPQFGQTLNSFEGNNSVTDQLNALKGKDAGSANSQQVDNSALFNVTRPVAAPDFAGISQWLNPSTPVTMQSLRGKVVLVDFWTYSCINCIRTLPHVAKWYDTYKDKGFDVIGVHTPEFEFEHDTNNVLAAIKQYNIRYPVAQDNDYATWNAYSNEYWPAEYLIDAKGLVRRVDFGEGQYNEMEMAIQALLKESGQSISTVITSLPDQTPKAEISPETYIGSKRMLYLFPNGTTQNGPSQFNLAPDLPLNQFSFGGSWNIADEFSTAGQGAALHYHFSANKVYLVMNPPKGGSGKVKVLLDGNTIDQSSAGSDVKNGEVSVDSDRLYNLTSLPGQVSEHTLELQFETPGIEVYAFTFGD